MQGDGKERSCPLCGAKKLKIHLQAILPSSQRESSTYRCTSHEYGRHPDILRCLACRFVFLQDRPSADELLRLYGDVEDLQYEREEAGRVATFSTHLARLEGIIGVPAGRSLLDVGAYTGVAVEVAAKRGWQAVGVEPSRWAVDSARRRGRNLINGTPDNPTVRALGPYAVATLWDVIEHLADPEEVLATVHGILRPDGYVVINTMDVESLFARISGRHWPWYMEMHLYYFSPATLTTLLRKTGFEPVCVERGGRTVSARYLASRLTAWVPVIGKPAERFVKWLGLNDRLVRIGFGDLFTLVARRR